MVYVQMFQHPCNYKWGGCSNAKFCLLKIDVILLANACRQNGRNKVSSFFFVTKKPQLKTMNGTYLNVARFQIH